MNSASLRGVLINLLTAAQMLNYPQEHNAWHGFCSISLKDLGYTVQCLCSTGIKKIEHVIQISLSRN